MSSPACDCGKNDCPNANCRRTYQREYRRRRRLEDPEFAERERAHRRASNRRNAARNALKKKARDALRNAVVRGRVVPGACEIGNDCEGRIEGHHENYERPLDVTWLCVRHHMERHRRIA